jgi:hypothetical protein
MTTTSTPSSSPHESEEEHADVIEATKDDDSVLPIDTAGMGTKETKALKKLWKGSSPAPGA